MRETKKKLLGTLNYVIANLQADESIPTTEWQAVMISREVLAGCSALQLAKAVDRVRIKLGVS